MQIAELGIETPPEQIPPPPTEDSDFSFLDLTLILLKRRRLIVACVLGFAVVTAIVSLLMPSVYTATTVVLPPQNASAGAALLSQLTNMGPMAALAGGSLGMKTQNDMYVAMFQSRTVEDAMVDRFDLKSMYRVKKQSDARHAFEADCEVKSSSKDGLIHISVSGRDPKRASEIANAYVEEYRKLSGSLAITEASQRRLFFEQQLAGAKDNLANAEEALKKTQLSTGMLQLDSQARSLIEAAGSLRAQIAVKEVEIKGMQSFASEQNPDLLLAKQQLAGWQAQLSRLTGNKNDNADDFLLAKRQVPEAGLEYVRKMRDVKYYETIFELLAKQYEMAKLDEARQGSLVQVMDPAVPPDRRSSPRRTLMVLLATAIGLFVGVFAAFAIEGLAVAQRKPKDRERIEQVRAMLFAKRAR